jgi:uncharacterized repeat protein (TIGR01451 family)
VPQPPRGSHVAATAYPVRQAAYNPADLPPDSWTGAADAPYRLPGAPGGVCPRPESTYLVADPSLPQPWRPPYIPGPWPADEYLFDGGDRDTSAEVQQDWSVTGLDQEDTIAHYDTLDGRTEVKAANRVAIYAPRFASVRKVYGLQIHEQHDRAAGVHLRATTQTRGERQLATTVHQPLEAGRYLGVDGPQRFRDFVRGASLDNGLSLAALVNEFKGFEDFQIIRNGGFNNSEKARLTEHLDAALAWSADQAVQVVIDEVQASISTGHTQLHSVYRYEVPPGKPRLRIVKVASQQHAQPGDVIEFTLRFDNIGDRVIGNVTIIDSLTTRLEYVLDSAQCSVKAKFQSAENEGQSLVLRWEIEEPLPVAAGGIIRFKCRVR